MRCHLDCHFQLINYSIFLILLAADAFCLFIIHTLKYRLFLYWSKPCLKIPFILVSEEAGLFLTKLLNKSSAATNFAKKNDSIERSVSNKIFIPVPVVLVPVPSRWYSTRYSTVSVPVLPVLVSKFLIEMLRCLAGLKWLSHTSIQFF